MRPIIKINFNSHYFYHLNFYFLRLQFFPLIFNFLFYIRLVLLLRLIVIDSKN